MLLGFARRMAKWPTSTSYVNVKWNPERKGMLLHAFALLQSEEVWNMQGADFPRAIRFASHTSATESTTELKSAPFSRPHRKDPACAGTEGVALCKSRATAGPGSFCSSTGNECRLFYRKDQDSTSSSSKCEFHRRVRSKKGTGGTPGF